MIATLTLKPPLHLRDHGLVFDPKEHVYTLPDGTLYTGVTTVLKALGGRDWLAGWAVKMTAEDIYKRIAAETKPLSPAALKAACDEGKKAWRATSAEARDVGTEVHKWIEAKRAGEPLPPLTTDGAKRGTEALLDWERKHKVRIIASEQIVASHLHKVAGTLDCVAEIDGRVGVGDYKTSSGIYPEMGLQTAAYKMCYEEMASDLTPKLDGRFIVRLDKRTGAFEFRWIESPLGFDTETFLHLREVHRWMLLQERLKAEGAG